MRTTVFMLGFSSCNQLIIRNLSHCVLASDPRIKGGALAIPAQLPGEITIRAASQNSELTHKAINSRN